MGTISEIVAPPPRQWHGDRVRLAVGIAVLALLSSACFLLRPNGDVNPTECLPNAGIDGPTQPYPQANKRFDWTGNPTSIQFAAGDLQQGQGATGQITNVDGKWFLSTEFEELPRRGLDSSGTSASIIGSPTLDSIGPHIVGIYLHRTDDLTQVGSACFDGRVVEYGVAGVGTELTYTAYLSNEWEGGANGGRVFPPTNGMTMPPVGTELQMTLVYELYTQESLDNLPGPCLGQTCFPSYLADPVPWVGVQVESPESGDQFLVGEQLVGSVRVLGDLSRMGLGEAQQGTVGFCVGLVIDGGGVCYPEFVSSLDPDGRISVFTEPFSEEGEYEFFSIVELKPGTPTPGNQLGKRPLMGVGEDPGGFINVFPEDESGQPTAGRAPTAGNGVPYTRDASGAVRLG